MRRVGVAAVLALVGALGAGCGGLPIPTGVRVERTVADGGPESGTGNVRVLPPGPVDGASPIDIVRGFLNAQADGETDYAIARTYLEPGVGWRTTGPVAVYDTARYPGDAAKPTATALTTDPATTTATVGVVLDRSASLDLAGVFTPRADTVTDDFRLVEIAGQWRIANPPDGLQLTAADLQRTYVPSTLWWFTPDLVTLVPEVRWLPSVVAGRQTQLVRALLTGPSGPLADVVRTAAPAGVTLDGSVSAAGSDVVVNLAQSAAALAPTAARLLLVQLAATLAQTQTGDAVRLEVDGQPLPSSLAPQRLLISKAAGYDPDAADPQAPSVALVAGRVTAVAGSAPLPAAAAALTGRNLVVAVPAPAGGFVAAVERTGKAERVLVADSSGVVRPVGAAVPVGGYGTPSWSLGGTLVVPGPNGLLVAPAGSAPGAAPVVLATPAALGRVTSVRIARDGVRLLLVAGSAAYLSTLSNRAGAAALGTFVPVSTGLGAVSQAGWESSGMLAMVVRAVAGTLSLAQLAQDGSQRDLLPLPASVGSADVVLATAPGVPVLVGGAGAIARLTGDATWRTVATGRAPAAPG